MKRFLKYMAFGIFLLIFTGCGKGKQAGPEDGTTVEHIEKKAAITSNEVELFSCFFLAEEEDDIVGNAEYSFSITKEDGGIKGSARCDSFCEKDSYNASFTLDEAELTEFAKLISDSGIEQLNGIYRETSGLPVGMGCEVAVRYASGERIYCYDNGENLLSADQMERLVQWFDAKTNIVPDETQAQ